jgi:hypothetical protein
MPRHSKQTSIPFHTVSFRPRKALATKIQAIELLHSQRVAAAMLHAEDTMDTIQVVHLSVDLLGYSLHRSQLLQVS